jgi:ABC-type uncharacterized transport system substrate-binding protein
VARTTSFIGIFILALGLWLSGPTQRADAHPHVWIDLKSQFEFDTDGRITGLKIDWTFDEFYTAFVVADAGGPEAMDQETLTGIGRGNLANLREYNYFTEFRADGAIQPFAVPETFDMGLKDGKLWLRFSVPLETPLRPAEHRISYAVFDPSYYVEILHVDGGHRLPADRGPEGCRTVLEEPNPTTEALSLAESLDVMDSAPESFGALFAQRVRLECN